MTKLDFELRQYVYEMLKKAKTKKFGKKDAIGGLQKIVPVLKGPMSNIDTDTAILSVWFGSFCVKVLNGVVIERSPNIEDFFKIVREVDYKDFYDILDKIFKAHDEMLKQKQQREI